MNFDDFILPVIIQNAKDYNPNETKNKFKQISKILAIQAFWLELEQILTKNSKHIDAICFVGSYHQGANNWMQVVAKPGANSAKLYSISKQFSKARGKFGNTNEGINNLVQAVRNAALKNNQLTLENINIALNNSLGEFAGFRNSTIESKELDSVTSNAIKEALSFKPKNRI